MVPDLMSIQADGKIPIDLGDTGLAQNSKQKEAKKGDCRQISTAEPKASHFLGEKADG